MPTNEGFLQLLRRLYPAQDVIRTTAEINPHLASLIFVLTVDEEAFAAVFPDENTVVPGALFDRYPEMDRTVITSESVQAMLPYRNGFAEVQRAWWRLTSGYEPPPCPPLAKMKNLVTYTKRFD